MVYSVADMAVAAEVIDRQAFSEFCGVTSSNQVPNGDTIGRFRNILIQNRLQEKLFADIVSRLKARGLMLMKEGYDRCLHIDCCAFFHQE